MDKYNVLIIAPLKKFKPLNEILKDWYHLGMAFDIGMARSCLKMNLPNLILLDAELLEQVDLPVGNFCCELKVGGCQTEAIPILLITSHSKQLESGYYLDIADHIEYPFQAQIIRRRVATQITINRAEMAERHYAELLEARVNQRTKQLLESQRAAIFMLGEAGHYNDNDTGVHIWRMAAYSALLARKAGWDPNDCQLLELAAPMHDTGKIGIPDYILKKPAALNTSEWEIMKTHTTIGRDILIKSDTPLFKLAAEIAENHHEKWDGTGYPNGLKENEIPWSARIVALADVFDALTMKRPYKEPWSLEDSFNLLEKSAGQHFDPILVDQFLMSKKEIIEIKERFIHFR